MKHVLPIAILTFAACGGGNKPSSPDATPAPSGPVTVTSITPADGATKVSPYAKVTIALSGAADAASITKDTVRITYGDSKLRVIGDVAYDAASHTITFTPAAPLRPFPDTLVETTAITVDVKGVTAGGAAVAEATARFRTLADPKQHAVFRNETKVLEDIVWDHDANGNPTLETYHSPGADGKLGTADDGIKSLRLLTVDAHHQSIASVSDPGPDGKWMTSDDVIDDHVEITYNAAGYWSQWADYIDPGADGKWMTADDLVGSYSTFTFDDKDRPILEVDGDAGADGKIGTADDTIQGNGVPTYDGDNYLPTRTISYGDPGPDGKWMTADDVVAGWTDNKIDARGLATKSTSMLPGADGKIDTADDQVQQVSSPSYDGHGNPTQELTSVAAGPDNQFGTADDISGSTFIHTIDPDGAFATFKVVEPGADQKYGTADDYASNDLTYDASL